MLGLVPRSNTRLALPAFALLAVFFMAPIMVMIRTSFETLDTHGVRAGGFTLEHYARFFTVDIYLKVLLTTVRIAVVTSILAAVIAVPVAWAIARSRPLVSRAMLLIIVSPLLINIVARTFGWRIILGRVGPLNMTLNWLGIEPQGMLLYTESAIVIGSLHLFLPLMVLPVCNAMAAVPPALEASAASLGAGRLETFLKVTLPLSLPGFGVGAVLVFTLTASSYVLPAILGGDFAKMLGTLVEEQLLSVSNWPFGAAIACVMLLFNLAIVGGYNIAIDKKLKRWSAQ